VSFGEYLPGSFSSSLSRHALLRLNTGSQSINTSKSLIGKLNNMTHLSFKPVKSKSKSTFFYIAILTNGPGPLYTVGNVKVRLRYAVFMAPLVALHLRGVTCELSRVKHYSVNRNRNPTVFASIITNSEG
jgi:hypothetical protein